MELEAAKRAQLSMESSRSKPLLAIGAVTACWVALMGINWMRGATTRGSVNVIFPCLGFGAYMLTKESKELIPEKKEHYYKCLDAWLESKIILFKGEAGEVTLTGEDARKFRLTPAQMLWPSLTLKEQTKEFPGYLDQLVGKVWGGFSFSKKEDNYFLLKKYYQTSCLSNDAAEKIKAVVGDFRNVLGAWIAVKVREKLKDSSNYRFLDKEGQSKEERFDVYSNAHTFIRSEQILDPLLMKVEDCFLTDWAYHANLQFKVAER